MPTRTTKILAFAMAMLATVAACNNDGCYDNQSSVPLAGLYSASNDEPIRLDSLQISGIGAPSDSILYTAGTKLSQIYLPMRSTATSTSWEIVYKWHLLEQFDIRDTITFDYTSQLYFVSDQCGVVYNYKINRVAYTTNIIDRVEVSDSLINNIDTERIKIYFRTSDDDEEPDEPNEPNEENI